MQALTAWTKNLASANPALIQNTTLAAAGFVALNVGVTALRYSFLSLKAATLGAIAVSRLFIATPIGLTLTVIAGAVYLLYQNWDKIKALMPNVAKAVENAINWMKQHWSELPGKVWEVAVAIKDKLLNTDWLEVGKQMIASLWEGMKSWLDKIVSGVGEYVGKIKGLFVGSASASTGGSATSMSGSTGGSGGRASLSSGDGASAGSAVAAASRGPLRGRLTDLQGNTLAAAPGGGGARGMIANRLNRVATGGSGLLDRIARAEGTAGRGDYNTVLGYGRYGLPNKPLTDMTLAEAFAFGRQVKSKHGRSSALGRYQIVGNTMKLVMPKLGLKWSDKFSAANQDAMARVIYRMQGLGAWEGFKRHARRARGGPVHAGQSYVVGEGGWEIFKPRQSGEIVNQKQLAAQGGKTHGDSNVTFHATFHVNGATDPQQVAQQVERHIREKVRSVFRGSHSDIGFAPI
jgi:hypothetical protein